MASEWDVMVKREVRRVSFEVRNHEGQKKVFVTVESELGPIADFECDGQDQQGLKQLLQKHKVLEAT